MLEKDPHKAKIGDDILPFEMGYLPDAYQKKAEVELHETPDRRVQCIRQLKEIIKRDKRLKTIDFDEDFLLQHLRARKFNVERAHANVKNFVSFVRKNPSSYFDFNYDMTVRAMTDNFVTILPWRCQDGCAIILVQLDNWNTTRLPIEEFKRMIVVVVLQALLDPMTQVNGFKAIFDVKSSSLRYLRYCTPNNLYLLYHGTQDCAPSRFKGVHILNDSLTFKTAWIIVKHFLSDKLKQRFHFHSSKETLLDFFPSACLPTQYGGELEDYDQSNWLKRVMEPEKLELIGGGCLKHLDDPI